MEMIRTLSLYLIAERERERERLEKKKRKKRWGCRTKNILAMHPLR